MFHNVFNKPKLPPRVKQKTVVTMYGRRRQL